MIRQLFLHVEIPHCWAYFPPQNDASSQNDGTGQVLTLSFYSFSRAKGQRPHCFTFIAFLVNILSKVDADFVPTTLQATTMALEWNIQILTVMAVSSHFK